MGRPPGRRRHPALAVPAREGRRRGLHIVEGLVKALDMIDAVVKAIRASKDRAAARDRADGQAVRASRRSRPTTFSTWRSAGSRSSAATSSSTRRRSSPATVKELQRILAKRDVLMGVIREELAAIRDEHKAPRRTEIVADDAGTIDVVALVEDEPYVVTVTARGYVRAVPERAGAKVGERRRARRDRAGDRDDGARRACCSSPIAAARTARPCTSCRRTG